MPHASIGIIGSGPIGRGLAFLLDRAGYSVTIGTRNPAALKLDPGWKRGVVGTFSEAARADIVFLAVAHTAVQDVALSLRNDLSGKLLIDTTNAVSRDKDGRICSGLPDGITEGTWMSEVLPDSRIVRAFSHILDELLISRATRQPGIWAVAYAADDDESAQRVEQLIRHMDYVPVRIGTLAKSAPLDPGGILFPNMFTAPDMEALVYRNQV